MHSLKDLENTLGQSYEQIRRRVNELDDRFEGIVEKGKRNKTLVTDNGLTLLRRLKELEDKGYSVESGLREIEEEVSNGDGTRNSADAKEENGSDQAVEILAQEIEFLREQLREKDRQLEKRDEHIQHLIPASDDAETQSLWEHLREWLQAPVG